MEKPYTIIFEKECRVHENTVRGRKGRKYKYARVIIDLPSHYAVYDKVRVIVLPPDEDLLGKMRSMIERILRVQKSILRRLDEMEIALKVALGQRTPTRTMKTTNKLSGDIPSFLIDNPWLEVLKRRGAQ